MATPGVSNEYVTIRVINTAGQPITNANVTINGITLSYNVGDKNYTNTKIVYDKNTKYSYAISAKGYKSKNGTTTSPNTEVTLESTSESTSIQTEITRIANAKADIRTAINNKGGNVSDTATIDTFASAINSLSTGGGNTSDSLIPTIGIGINGYMVDDSDDVRCVPIILGFEDNLLIALDYAKYNNQHVNKTDNNIFVSYSYINKDQFANKHFYYEDFKNIDSDLFNLELLLVGNDNEYNCAVKLIQRHIYAVNGKTGLDGDTFIDTATLDDIVNLGTKCIVAILKNK